MTASSSVSVHGFLAALPHADWLYGHFAAEHAATRRIAQLGVYYRLLGVPVPGAYGPSADD